MTINQLAWNLVMMMEARLRGTQQLTLDGILKQQRREREGRYV